MDRLEHKELKHPVDVPGLGLLPLPTDGKFPAPEPVRIRHEDLPKTPMQVAQQLAQLPVPSEAGHALPAGSIVVEQPDGSQLITIPLPHPHTHSTKDMLLYHHNRLAEMESWAKMAIAKLMGDAMVMKQRIIQLETGAVKAAAAMEPMVAGLAKLPLPGEAVKDLMVVNGVLKAVERVEPRLPQVLPQVPRLPDILQRPPAVVPAHPVEGVH